MTNITYTPYNTMTRAALVREAKSAWGVSSLLAKPDANPKLAKGEKQGVLSAPLHLAPHNLSGYNVCPMATQGCAAACLHTAGNPAYQSGKDRARIARTQLYFGNRRLFFALLIAEIAAHEKAAKRKGMIAAVRLNATSDIRWESVRLITRGPNFSPIPETVFSLFPNVVFYDYTKIANRRNLPVNYHLTFSLADGNDAQAVEAFHNGLNVAVVFDTKRNKPLPSTFSLMTEQGGFDAQVIDGDKTDFRPSDGRGVIVGLRAKGDAIGDTSGFVRQAAPLDYSSQIELSKFVKEAA
ncbi:hypothetical protein [Limnobacter sp.]|uniref:GP88 family protein n=1 Tax=Limnobacter sp. TaxID=2003368 RepID=UPI0025B94540|nr:hypothetical protein [Limnobacter sp.]